MAIKGFKRNFKPLEIAREDQVEAICRGTLQVLEETGAEFHDERALKLFADSGCRVDCSPGKDTEHDGRQLE